MALTISCARKQAVERALHLKQFGWCRPRCTGWTACLWARSIRRRLWAALGWCLRWRITIGATCTGALCAWAARWGTGQRHWRLASGGLRYRLRTGRLRVTGWRLWLSEVWMPFCYRCLLDWNEQIRVSHVQFKIPPVSGRGVTSGLPSWWYRHSAGHRLSPNLVILARLLGWTLLSGTVSETKTWDVLVCLILPLRFAEMTVFWPFITRWRPEMTEFSLSDSAFSSLAAEGTALCCKKESCMCGMSGPLGLMCERFLVSCLPVASTWVLYLLPLSVIPVTKASIHLLPGPKTWHLSPTTNGLAFLALLLESWSSIIFSCLSCNTERMALMSISACALVVRFLPWSISAGDSRPAPMRVVLKSAKTSWNDRVFELFESIFLTVWMCRSMKPLEWGYPGDEVVCLMPKPERNLANSLLWNGGPLSDTISSGYPSIEKRSIRQSLNDQNDVLAL